MCGTQDPIRDKGDRLGMGEGQAGNSKIVRVLFAVPNEGHTEPEAYDDRMTLLFHLGALQALSFYGQKTLNGLAFDYPEGTKFEFSQAVIGHVFTSLARERLAEESLKLGMDYLFMVDDDMMCPVDLFERLYKHNVDIVAPLAFGRYPPHKPVIYKLHSGYDAISRKDYYINYPVLKYPKNTLVECDAVGFGAVLIKTEVFKKLPKPWFMVTSGAGEDIHFCHSAGKAGFKIFADTATKLGHLSTRINVDEAVYESEENQKLIETTGGK